MTAIQRQTTSRLSTPENLDHNGVAPPHHAKSAAGHDHHDLATALAFIRRELSQSATTLGDLADRLSQTLCALASSDDKGSFQSHLADGTIALQSEDRIQQRLCDLTSILAVLERSLADGQSQSGIELDQTIIDSLRLEEMRHAFAVAAGMPNTLHQPSDEAVKPSVGDIDLF